MVYLDGVFEVQFKKFDYVQFTFHKKYLLQVFHPSLWLTFSHFQNTLFS